MKTQISKEFLDYEEQILHYLYNFRYEGEPFGDGQRNIIKVFPLNGTEINIKSFKIPNAINKVAYRFFRKSKAERSYKYAQILLSKGICTPFPVAFSEEKKGCLLLKSFYISEQIRLQLTFRELVEIPDFPDHESILRAFTRFTFELHEKNINFLDHSPGNTLIRKKGEDYEFFLVDLNRMKFGKMDFEARMKNFWRLTPKKEMIKIMANEYSKLYPRSEEEIYSKMWFYTEKFKEKLKRKKAWKEKLKI